MNKFFESLKYTYLYDLVSPIFQIIKTIDWYLKGKHTDTPHLVKQKTIKSYQEKYSTKILVETGTYLGMMVNATKDNFKKVYTIELDKKLYLHAKYKFKKFNHIKIYLGDSAKILPKLLKIIQEPSLFWLDAHYSKGLTAKGDKETPILSELTAILSHKIKNHVILIDDANAFAGKNDYPSLDELKKFILKKRPYMEFNVLHNIIRITP